MKAVVRFLACAMLVTSALAQAQSEPASKPKTADAKPEGDAAKPSKPKAKHAKHADKEKTAPPLAASEPKPARSADKHADDKPDADAPPVVAVTKITPPPPTSTDGPKRACTLAEAEQPRGGRLEVLSDAFGSAPVVRIDGKPARMIERREDRVSVQVPADSNGGPITLLHDGRSSTCGNLTIIGKNR
jgi:hypothetical protein